MRRAYAFIAFSAVSACAIQAHAGTVTIQNTTDVVEYGVGSAAGPTGSVGSASIGPEFQTSQLAYTTTLLGNGNYALDLQYTTMFSGNETLDNGHGTNYQIYYPDIFLRTTSVGYSNAPFNYAISLGDEVANGGLAAGFYTAGAFKTSQDIWGGRSGIKYGGQYTNTDTLKPGQAGFTGYDAPVVLTKGTKLAKATITTAGSAGVYTIAAKVTLTAAEAAGFIDGADVFWGTGDCANGAFLAQFSPSGSGGPSGGPVPEPAALLLVGVGLGCIGLVRRKQVAI